MWARLSVLAEVRLGQNGKLVDSTASPSPSHYFNLPLVSEVSHPSFPLLPLLITAFSFIKISPRSFTGKVGDGRRSTPPIPVLLSTLVPSGKAQSTALHIDGSFSQLARPLSRPSSSPSSVNFSILSAISLLQALITMTSISITDRASPDCSLRSR